MANPRTKKTPAKDSTTATPKSNKLSSVRKSKVTPQSIPVPFPTPCNCCDCSAQSSGGVWTCEDGVCVYIPKPNYFAVLVSDPNIPLPYWARPTDLGLNCPPPGKTKVNRAKRH